MLETVDPEGALWHATFERGALPRRRPGLAIARRAAEEAAQSNMAEGPGNPPGALLLVAVGRFGEELGPD